MSSPVALPYREPDILTISITSAFFLCLTVINYVLDRIIYCGLVGQSLIGVAWGSPGARWLTREAEETVTQLGYLGLILIVYEGGLSTDINNLKANLPLSGTVPLIGISAPIALSFVLRSLLDISALQAFAAGAALCTTSLGTTFTVLSTGGLTEARLGVVLTSAAMMDDVVGLVMIQVISKLGLGSAVDAVTVVKPVAVSIAFVVILPLVCAWAIEPLALRLIEGDRSPILGYMERCIGGRNLAFILHTTVLVALVTGSSYAGTSNLFVAYLAGAAITWFDSLGVTTPQNNASSRAQANVRGGRSLDSEQKQEAAGEIGISETAGTSSKKCNGLGSADEQIARPELAGIAIYKTYYSPAVNTILKPFFFAPIGFAIPITHSDVLRPRSLARIGVRGIHDTGQSFLWALPSTLRRPTFSSQSYQRSAHEIHQGLRAMAESTQAVSIFRLV